MEFNEKLQLLRKNKGITQEELADELYVSRTAISKWESGRGYPNIESLKEISKYFSVSIDDLLSAEKLISIAERDQSLGRLLLYHLLGACCTLITLVICLLGWPLLLRRPLCQSRD